MTNREDGIATVLVTGAAGRLGSVVVPRLAGAGMHVIPSDRVGGSVASRPIRTVDLVDAAPLSRLLEGVSAVVHCAGWPGQGAASPADILAWNVEGTLNLCQAALAAGVRKFVYASSIQVVASEPAPPGDGPAVDHLPLDGDCPPGPRNLYGFSKAVGELLVRSLLSTAGVECQSLRFPWLVTPEPGQPWGRRLKPFHVEEARAHVEQGFTCLSFRDAAGLVLACLTTALPGYRTYYPAVSVVPAEQLERYLDRYYAGVDLRRPRREMSSLVDLSRIEAETGWVPEDIPDRPVILRQRSWLRRVLGMRR